MLDETFPLGFDQDSQDPDEPEAESGCFSTAEPFIHEQQVGLELGGQGDRFRLAAIELILEGCHHIRLTDVLADDPIEGLDLDGSRTPETLNHHLIVDGSRDRDGAIKFSQEVQSPVGGEADQW